MRDRSGVSGETLPSLEEDDETRRLLQRRLTLVFTVLFGVALYYGVTPLIALVVSDAPPSVPTVVPIVTLAVGLINGALALRCRVGERSVRELHVQDAIACLVTCWATAVSMTQVRPVQEATVSLQLGVTYVLMARAVLLPSSGRRTLTLCALALVPDGMLATWMRVRAFSPSAEPAGWLVHGYLVFRTLAMTAFLATLTSSVIYGLRLRVRESERIGQYLLTQKIGEGGMGVVYRATHALLRRDTAVKLIIPSRVGPQRIARFEREVKLTARLTHPNTVAIFDYGRTPDGVFYYAMEHLDGGDLEMLVDHSGPLPPGRVIWILEQICRALSEAHRLGLVHRDVKPANVLVCERGGEGDVTKILDFGLVKELSGTEGAKSSGTERLLGTPLYMSPEAIAAPDRVDARSDLYSLGALAYFLLVGRPPFSGKNVVEICAAHLHDAPPKPSLVQAEVEPALDAVILRCLAKDQAHRFPDARGVREALLDCSAASSWSRAQADDWWRSRGESFRLHCEARRARTAAGGDRSVGASALRIDLERRDGG